MMTTESPRIPLTADTLEVFRARFGTLHDAVIYNIDMALFSRTQPTIFTIALGAKSLEAPRHDPWVTLTLVIEDVTDFHLENSEDYEYSVIFEAAICCFDDKVYMDFYSNTSHNSPSDFICNRDVNGPCLIVVGKRCYWYMQHKDHYISRY